MEESARALSAETFDLSPTLHRERVRPQSKHVKYQHLTMIDRAHAECLSYTCRLSPDAKRVSRMLANRSLLQSLLTSIPLLATDFVTLWVLLCVATMIVERLCGLTPNLVTRDTSFVASLLLAPIAHLVGLYPAFGMSAAVEFRQLVKSALTSLCIFPGIGIVSNVAHWPYFVASSFFTLLLAIPILPGARFTVRCLVSRYSWRGAPVLIVAKADIAKELFQRLQIMQDRGLRPAAVLLSPEDYWSEGKRLQEQGIPAFDVRSTLECVQRYMATWILIDTGNKPWNDLPEMEAEINAIPNRVLISPNRILRPFSLDEFPQLWNILRGDMSLVGPRPIVDSPNYDSKYINDYPNEFEAYSSRRPGLTGLWQVNCRNSGVYEMRIYWDMYYIRNWSLWLDLYIILRTFRTVLMREGAY